MNFTFQTSSSATPAEKFAADLKKEDRLKRLRELQMKRVSSKQNKQIADQILYSTVELIKL